mmetsp:Transcript_59122/g.175748  ORF Transcript_59122/g.175748 Transcript_59122/m.175748 type:complete len:379 (-) Transcript_59122:286-1422(-)
MASFILSVAAAIVAIAGSASSFPVADLRHRPFPGGAWARPAHRGEDPSRDDAVDGRINIDGEAARRAFLRSMMIGAAAAAAGGSALSIDPRAASAAVASDAGGAPPVALAPGLVSPSEVARRLRAIPTFTLVDRRGVPFMVFGEDAKLTAYFFTEYGEAARILKLATASSDGARAEAREEFRRTRREEGGPPPTKEEENEEVGSNPWREARISTVPLDFAVTLSTRAPRGSYFRVAPSEEDIGDALALDGGKDDLPEGKVPLFYFEDFNVPASAAPSIGSGDGVPENSLSEVSPLYFQKSELLAAWKRANPKGKIVPEMKVTELFSVITEMVKPGGDDDELKSLVFVPPADSSSKEKECKRKGGKEKPFIVGERIVVL